MENMKGNNIRSVPQFGGWDQTTGAETNYSMVFQKARDNRKKHTNKVVTSNSVGNERELLNKPQDIPVAGRKMQIDGVVASNNVGNERELLNKPQDIPIASRKMQIDEVVASNNVGNERELLNKPQDIPVASRKKHTNKVATSNSVGNERELLNKPQDIPVANRKKNTIEVAASNNKGNERELFNKPQDNDLPVANNLRSVPQFGGWDQKAEGETNYSMVFQKARANRKKHFIEVETSNNVVNERELLTKPQKADVPIVNNMRSVPQFGAWDYETGGETNYSMVFQQARDNRKKQKNEVTTSSSIGNERELLNKPQNQDVTVVKKKRLGSYLSCCIRPY